MVNEQRNLYKTQYAQIRTPQTNNTITHLESLSLAFPNPYAIAGEGVIKIEDAPAIAAVVLAILSKNPRRLTSPSFAIESADD